ncbi:lysophospholipase L2 [Enterobacillus tribolii]|uniref:Lysophospholipase L2 n=1 Tax=Enterobacillus tribolii TaxID=1487935 RepID=A0A370QU33_9GAMM|nr:lysophospholipase L2 [Enterobacillus tribolii]MBW7981179.1 lysophospholipase L2 [Enterobacillus tribolii]RDK92762.1 lysophospholipase [Enterobacillus tribolii]
MPSLSQSWLHRESEFAAFTTGPLLDFWQRREEGEFIGVDDVPIRFVRLCSPEHNRVVVISPGRIESYMKYPEVAYDLFHCGYDVMIIDHRGQGLSGRMLTDHHRGHVRRFDDYVEDLTRFWQLEIEPRDYVRRFALAHSMGGAVLALMLTRNPQAFDAVALCAPMFGIKLPMPLWMAKKVTGWVERRPAMRDSYAIGTGHWRPLPFIVNALTHSRPRYRRFLRYYADYPELRVGGPTYHWVREGIFAGERAIAGAGKITTPLLLLQAEEDRVVVNAAQVAFCQALTHAGHPPYGGEPLVIQGARHEILFEQDKRRAVALDAIVHFFALHSDSAAEIPANSSRG